VDTAFSIFGGSQHPTSQGKVIDKISPTYWVIRTKYILKFYYRAVNKILDRILVPYGTAEAHPTYFRIWSREAGRILGTNTRSLCSSIIYIIPSRHMYTYSMSIRIFELNCLVKRYGVMVLKCSNDCC